MKLEIPRSLKAEHEEHAAFAGALKLHALTEEKVSYPTAPLIGEYVKLRSRG